MKLKETTVVKSQQTSVGLQSELSHLLKVYSAVRGAHIHEALYKIILAVCVRLCV